MLWCSINLTNRIIWWYTQIWLVIRKIPLPIPIQNSFDRKQILYCHQCLKISTDIWTEMPFIVQLGKWGEYKPHQNLMWLCTYVNEHINPCLFSNYTVPLDKTGLGAILLSGIYLSCKLWYLTKSFSLILRSVEYTTYCFYQTAYPSPRQPSLPLIQSKWIFAALVCDYKAGLMRTRGQFCVNPVPI